MAHLVQGLGNLIVEVRCKIQFNAKFAYITAYFRILIRICISVERITTNTNTTVTIFQLRLCMLLLSNSLTQDLTVSAAEIPRPGGRV